MLGLLFVPECDDCYFIFWKFDSWQDLLLTRPNTQDALVVGVPHNGRYLGNLLGLILGAALVVVLVRWAARRQRNRRYGGRGHRWRRMM